MANAIATLDPAPPVGAAIVENRRWVDEFAARPDLVAGPERLVAFRREAVERLGATPFPTRRDEDWQYSDFTRALREDYSLADALAPDFEREAFEIDAFEGYVLVTVDGVYRPELSDEVAGITVGTVGAYLAEEPYAFWLDRTLSELHAASSNAFVALNAAFAKGSLFIAAERNARLEQPIHIIHLATRAQQRRMVCSQVFCMLPVGAEVTIDETFETLGEGEAIFRNHVMRAGLAANARLHFRSIQDEAPTDYHVSNTGVAQRSGSLFDHVRADLGGAQVRNNLDVEHEADGLETKLAGLYIASDRQRIDNQTFIDHAYPHGESSELYKGIVMDRAVTAFNGKVLVRPDAQKTNAFQQNDSLVIGDRAEANAKPQLEIFADDVKCSHGATIGQLDESPVYYLRARGIPRGEAIAMLQRGFVLEVLEAIESDAVRAYVERIALAKFNA